jgi:hypothetical protein
MKDQKARDAIAALAREVAGLAITLKEPRLSDADWAAPALAASYNRVIKNLKAICEKMED